MLTVAGCCAIGVALLLFCIDFPSVAHVVRSGDPRDDRLLLGCLTLVVAMPVVYLVATVARLSSDARDRRLAMLSLIGVSRGGVFTVVMSEVGALAVLGALAGVLLHAALRVPVETVWMSAGFTQRMSGLHLGRDALVALFVALAAGALAAAPALRSSRHALRAVRRGGRPGAQRVAAVLGVVGFAIVLATLVIPARHIDHDPKLILFVGLGMVCLGLGLASLTQTLLGLVARVLRRGRSATGLVMAARLDADRVAFSRALGGLVLSTFVVATGLCVFTAWKSTPQYLSTEWAVHHPSATVVTPTENSPEHAAQELRRRDGVESAEVMYSGYVGAEGSGARPVVSLSCRQIHPFAQVEGCSDDAVWVADQGDGGDVATSALTVGEGGAAHRFVPSAVHRVTSRGPQDGWGVSYLGSGTVVVPPRLLATSGIKPNAMFVVLAPGEHNDDVVDGGFVSTADWPNYDLVGKLQVFVFMLSAAVMMIGALTVVVATLDLVAARRRRVAALQVVGFPVGMLRRAQWGAMALPVVIGLVLAVAAGASCGLGYLRFGGYAESMPWGQLEGLLAMGLTAGLALALATGIGMGRALSPAMLRRE